MSAYQYNAIKKNGNSCRGVIEADSERHARALLREQGLFPTDVHLLKKSIANFKKNKLSSQDLSLLTRQLATLISAGIPIDEALSGVASQSEHQTTQKILIGVRAKVLEGYGLAEAMSDYPSAFPELYRATLAAGEKTGNLDLVLDKLADYTENQQIIKQKVQQALIYPTLMIVISVAIISFLLAFVVPKIVNVFSSNGQVLPIMTIILIKVSLFLKNYWLFMLLFITITILIFKKLLTINSYRLKLDGFLLKIPIISFLIKTINIARYIHTFGILFQAGVNIIETMRVSASLINNQVMRNAFDIAAIQVKEGTSIHVALKKTTYLKPIVSHLIASGEKSGQLPVMMERAALHLDSEVKRIIDTALSLLEPFIILTMGAVVLFIVLATLLPIFTMEQIVT